MTSRTNLEGQRLPSAQVIGHSEGATISPLLAVEHPERVRSLVTISANIAPSVFMPATESVHS